MTKRIRLARSQMALGIAVGNARRFSFGAAKRKPLESTREGGLQGVEG